MTENEYLEMPWSIEDTIENLKTIEEHLIATVLKANLDGKGKQDAREVEFDFNRAIQALEEIQQYRAIGTIGECQNNKVLADKRYEHFFDGMEQLEKYKAIGTVEEFKRAKEMEAVYGQVKWERDVAISQLEEIGVGLGQKMDEFKALKENKLEALLKDGQLLYQQGLVDGYDNAIQEFAERLKDLIAKNVEDAEKSNDLCCEIFQSEIDEIAEEMRGAE